MILRKGIRSVHFTFKTSMYNTLVVCCLLILTFCYGTFGSHVYLQYCTRSRNCSVPASESFELNYNEFDAFEFICSITSKTLSNGRYPALTWIEEGASNRPVTDEPSISSTKILKKSDDGTKLTCEVRSEALAKTWTISVGFIESKAAQERIKNKPGLFKLVLICLGGLIGAAIIIMISFRVLQCLRNKKRDKLGAVDDATLEIDKVSYAKVDVSKKRNSQSTNQPEYVEIGIDNLSCQIEENTYVKFDSEYIDSPKGDVVESPDSNIIKKNEDSTNVQTNYGSNSFSSQNDSSKIQILNKENDRLSSENQMDFANRKYSSDC